MGDLWEVFGEDEDDDLEAAIASVDYPVLSEILVERPPLPHSYQVTASANAAQGVTFQALYSGEDPNGERIEDGVAWAVARVGGQVVGALRWDYFSEPAVVLDVTVDEAYRRQGIGAGLFEFAQSQQGDLVHSDSLTSDGQAFVEALGALAPGEVLRTSATTHDLSAEAGIWGDLLDAVIDPPPLTYNTPSFDWCRFRRDQHCYFPQHLNQEATKQAGYEVWVVRDRGFCPRDKWDDQKACPISEPGPNSREPNALIECTRNWEEGGQRDGTPGPFRGPSGAYPGSNHMGVVASSVNAVALGDGVYEVDIDSIHPSYDEDPRDNFGDWGDESGAANPRDAHAALMAGMQSDGMDPIEVVVDDAGVAYIDDGHHRWAAAKDLGWRRVQVQFSSHFIDATDEDYDRFYQWLGVATATSSLRLGAMAGSLLPVLSAWKDVRAKAADIRKSGGVKIIAVTDRTVTAEVKGHSAIYQTTLLREGKSVAMWECSCPWAAYSWDRSGRWKRFEGRMCAHALALTFEAQSQEFGGGTITEGEGWSAQGEKPTFYEAPPKPENWQVSASRNSVFPLVIDPETGLVYLNDQAVIQYPTWHPTLGLTASKRGVADFERQENQTDPLDGVSLKQDDDGWYVTTHRARSDSYPSAEDIPDEDIEFIRSTGAAEPAGFEPTITEAVVSYGTPTVWVEPYRTQTRSGAEVEVWSFDYEGWHSISAFGFKVKKNGETAAQRYLIYDIAEIPANVRAAFESLRSEGALHTAVIEPDDPDAGMRQVEEVCAKGNHTHSGLVIKAVDSGRVLLTQRTPYGEDPEGVYGRWEFPGGGIGDDETPFRSAVREFTEETGLTLPEGWRVDGCYETGPYVAIVVLVPSEGWTTNAELLDFETMGIGWFHPDQIEGQDIAREEMDETEWDMVREAAKGEGWKELASPVRARILNTLPEWMGEPGEFAKSNPDLTQIPAGTEGVVRAWMLGDTVPMWRPDGNVKIKTGDHFLVAFPSVGVAGVILAEDQIELLDPIPRRKAAAKTAASLDVESYAARMQTEGAKTAVEDPGCMVAIVPPPAVLDALVALPYTTEPLEDLHITLAYLGKSVDMEVVNEILAHWAILQSVPLAGRISGLGTWLSGSDDGYVLWCSIDIPGLTALREDLVTILEEHGISLGSNYDYAPHLTLAYSDTPFENIPDLSDAARARWTVEGVVAACGDDWHSHDLGTGLMVLEGRYFTESEVRALGEEALAADPELRCSADEYEARRATAALGGVVQEDSPLNYHGLRPQRLAIRAPGEPGGPTAEADSSWAYFKPPHSALPEGDDTVAFLDFSEQSDSIYIHFMATRPDHGGQGLARRLVEHLYAMTDKDINWGSIVSDRAEALWRTFQESHPDRWNKAKLGANRHGAAFIFESDLTSDAMEMLSEGHAAGEVAEDRVTWYAPTEAGQSLAEAELHEEPEPALPSTDGAEDDDLEQRRRSLEGSGAITDADIAKAAQRHLAAAVFSPKEQMELIEEGDGQVEAANLDLLQIEGTHYEALDARLQSADDLFW